MINKHVFYCFIGKLAYHIGILRILNCNGCVEVYVKYYKTCPDATFVRIWMCE
jgi:hypothetical protein